MKDNFSKLSDEELDTLDIKTVMVPYTKLTNWKKEPKLEELKRDLEKAKPTHDSQISKIRHWQDLLNVEGSAKPPVVPGRSSIQPKLIRRQAEWRYSALSEPFLSSHNLFKVYPRTFEDAPAAQQNSLVLNWQFDTKINKVKFIDDYIRATVDEGTCIVRIGWNRITKPVTKTKPVYDFYEIEDEQLAQQLQQAMALLEASPRDFKEQVPEDLQAAIKVSQETGQLVAPHLVGEEQVQEEEIIVNNPTVEVLNPSNIYIDPSCHGDFDSAMFAVVSFETNRAQLQSTGLYKNLDKINWTNPSFDPDHVTDTPPDFTFADAARKRVIAYEYWGYYDIHGKGELVPIVATWVNDVLIRLEENPYPDGKLPFVVVPYLPIKRELFGEPDAELLEENQRILGAVTRGMIDSLGRSATGQQGYAKGMLDPLNRRRFERGEDYEFNPNAHPNQGIVQHTFPELPQSAMIMVQMQNQEAESLTGVKAFSGGLSGNAYGDVAAGIRGMLDAASKREMAILRRLAKGMQDIGNKIIAMNSEFLSEEEVVRVTNREFIKVRREDLKGNFDLEVDINTAEVDNAKAQDMAFMLQTLGPTLDPSMTQLIMAELAELKRMPELAEKIRTFQPQPDPFAQQMQEIQLQMAQLNLQKLQAETEFIMARAEKTQQEADSVAIDNQLEASGTKHLEEMERQQAQARGNQALEITKAFTRPRKPGDISPDVEAAIGFNALSGKLSKAPGMPNPVGKMPNPLQPPSSSVNQFPAEYQQAQVQPPFME